MSVTSNLLTCDITLVLENELDEVKLLPKILQHWQLKFSDKMSISYSEYVNIHISGFIYADIVEAAKDLERRLKSFDLDYFNYFITERISTYTWEREDGL